MWELSGSGAIVLRVIFQGAIILGGNCLGEIVREAIVPSDNCLGGNCPGGNGPIPLITLQEIINKNIKTAQISSEGD